MNAITHTASSPVYIVDGLRTPYLKAPSKPGPFSAADLAVQATQALLQRQPIQPTDISEVIVGCTMPSENEMNIARTIGLRAECGEKTPAFTVHRNCASGLQSVDSAFKDIILGRSELVLAGGTEAMSRAPFLFNPKLRDWMVDWKRAKAKDEKETQAKLLSQLQSNPFEYLEPIVALQKGLSDPLYRVMMGDTAQIVADQFQLSRTELDAYSAQSHQRAAQAQVKGYFKDEITPIFDQSGQAYSQDDGVRPESTVETLKSLKAIFSPDGIITAGNSSQVTDGAAMLILASEAAVKKYKLPILGRIVDLQWAALSPLTMSLGPVFAATPLLQRHHLGIKDIDYWEINEAFAATVLGCIRAWESDEFCKKYLGLSKAFGTVDQEKLNIDGGAIALGHPVGSSGTRIVLHLLHVLKRTGAKRGVASICIGGGQGGAILIERV